MLSKAFLIRSGTFNLLAVVAIGLSFALSYRIIYQTLPLQEIGVWALLTAGVAMGRLADMGLGSATTRTVGRLKSEGRSEEVLGVIVAGALISVLLVGVLAAVMLPVLLFLVSVLLVNVDQQRLALAMLPLTLSTLLVGGVSSILQGGLEGTGAVGAKSAVSLASAALNFVLVAMLLPGNGALRLALIQLLVTIGTALVAGSLVCLIIGISRKALQLPRARVLKEIIHLGISFQSISLVRLSFDPVTKLLLSLSGDLVYVAFYELAHRVLIQVRSIVTALTSGLMPAVVLAGPQRAAAVQKSFIAIRREVAVLSLVVHGSLLLTTPLMSYFMLGYWNLHFSFMLCLLTLAWGVNTVSVASYYMSLGMGNIGANLRIHLLMAAINVGVGYGLTLLTDGWGAILGWCAALLVGGFATERAFTRRMTLTSSATFTTLEMVASATIIMSAVSTNFALWGGYAITSPATVSSFGVGCFAVLIVVASHAQRSAALRQLAVMLRSLFSRASSVPHS